LGTVPKPKQELIFQEQVIPTFSWKRGRY